MSGEKRKNHRKEADKDQEGAPLEIGDSVKLFTTGRIGRRGDKVTIVKFEKPYVILKLQSGKLAKRTSKADPYGRTNTLPNKDIIPYSV